MPQPEPRPFDPESGALNIRPPRLPLSTRANSRDTSGASKGARREIEAIANPMFPSQDDSDPRSEIAIKEITKKES